MAGPQLRKWSVWFNAVTVSVEVDAVSEDEAKELAREQLMDELRRLDVTDGWVAREIAP